MIRVINFGALLKYVAVLTTALSILIYDFIKSYWANDWALIKIISIAPWISLALLLLLTSEKSARAIWCILKYFNYSLYPDLNGTWDGEITTETGSKIPAKATIRQNLFQTQVDLHTETSKSQTLETTPSVESGNPKLYYVYRSLPKETSRPSYTGSTIFDIRSIEDGSERILELSGYYFTDRKTTGRVRLRQINKETSCDISFY